MSGPRSNIAGVLVRRYLDVTESTLMLTTYKTNTHKGQKGKVLLIRTLAIWGGFSVSQKLLPKILLILMVLNGNREVISVNGGSDSSPLPTACRLVCRFADSL